VGENGGQAGSGNGGNTAVNGGQGGSGAGGLIPVVYVPSNGANAGNGTGGVNTPAANSNLPSLMPTTGHTTTLATTSVSTESSTSDSFLLTLAGLLFLLAGGFITGYARLNQGRISAGEVR
jgi:hypothetical protein